MRFKGRSVTSLLADDNPDDCLLVKDALIEPGRNFDLHGVEDGDALLSYLYRRGRFENTFHSSHPALILLDLNMPHKDGRDALRKSKSDSDPRSIPVVVLTTSSEDDDIHLTYKLGVNSFITKAETFYGLVEVVKAIKSYWFENGGPAV